MSVRAVWAEGRRCSAESVPIAVLGGGLHLARGAFQTLRVRDGGGVFQLEAHSERLARAAEAVGLEGAAAARIADELCDGLREGGLARQAGLARLLLFAEGARTRRIATFDSGRDPSASGMGPSGSPRWVRLLPLEAAAHFSRPGAQHKSFAWWALARAGEAARALGADDALGQTADGRWLEATRASFFAIRRGVLRTASLAEGVLDGVGRARVLRLAQALQLPCEERALNAAVAGEVEEAFTVSAARGIRPVRAIGQRQVPQVPGPRTQALLAAWDAPGFAD